jgi:hypothetical protein
MFKNHFIIVGPGRSGSTWLYELLSQDKRIGLARNIKETQFFNENYSQDLKNYFKFFDFEKPITGEISNLYFHDKKVPKRIYDSIENSKIIILVRNPVDRLVSIHNFRLREGRKLKKKVTFTDDEIIKYIRIDLAIENFQQYFSKKQIFYLDFHKIRLLGEKEIIKLYEHLELDYEKLKFPGLVNESIIPKHPVFGLITKKIAIILRYLKFYKILTFLKSNNLIKNLFFKKGKVYPRIPKKQKKLIDKEFNVVKRKVEELTGIKTKEWNNCFENKS